MNVVEFRRSRLVQQFVGTCAADLISHPTAHPIHGVGEALISLGMPIEIVDRADIAIRCHALDPGPQVFKILLRSDNHARQRDQEQY